MLVQKIKLPNISAIILAAGKSSRMKTPKPLLNLDKETLINSKRTCQFTAANVEEIDYKDVELLTKFINEMGKISPARMTGTSAKYQRQLTKAIKRARQLALLPYTDSHRIW